MCVGLAKQGLALDLGCVKNKTEQQIALKELILLPKKKKKKSLSCFQYPAPVAYRVIEHICNKPQSYQSKINITKMSARFLELGKKKGNSKGQWGL